LKKVVRYVRWLSKLAFLLLFMIPIAYVPPTEEWPVPMSPVVSLFSWGSPPFFYLPVTQSPCTIWLDGYCNINPGAWLLCPLGSIQSFLTLKIEPYYIVPSIMATLFFVALIILLGNFFCGWVCPVGAMIDCFDSFVKKFLPKIEAKRLERELQNKQNENGEVKKSVTLCRLCPLNRLIVSGNSVLATGALASTLVGAAVFRFNVFCTFCPIGISTRGLMHLKATTYLTRIKYLIIVELWAIPVIAVLLSLRERRFWCRKLCPVGALLNILGSFNFFIKPKIKGNKCVMKGCPEECRDYLYDYCGACRLEDAKRCEKACPVDVKLVNGDGLNKCTKCMECYIVCEYGAIVVEWVSIPRVNVRNSKFYK